MNISSENMMNVANLKTLEVHENINVEEYEITKETHGPEELEEKKIETENILMHRNNIGDALNNLIEIATEVSVSKEHFDANTISENDYKSASQNIEIYKAPKYIDAASQEKDIDLPVKTFRSRLQPLVDSDSSEDDENNISEELVEKSDLSKSFVSRKIEDSPDKEKSDYSIMKSRLKALCDSESSEDERETPIENYEDSLQTEKWLSNPKSKTKHSDKPVEKKMTPKEYEEQKLTIKSESQRMERERNVSLPYHRPKSRSIKEFLEKRPRFTAAFPSNVGKTPAILAIKMTNQNLEKISKKLEEREKMLEDFYKSESESEEEKMEEDCSKIETDIETENKLKYFLNQEITNVYPKIVGLDENETEVDSESTKNSVLQENIIATDDDYTKEINSDQIIESTTEEATISENSKRSPIEIISNITIIAENQPHNESIDYEFSLENAELSENIADCTNPTLEDKSSRDKHSTMESTSAINDIDFIPKKKLNRLQLLKESLGNSTPKLSGDPNDVFNLDDNVVSVKGGSGVDKLIERFIEHSRRRVGPKEDSVQVDIMSLSGGEMHKEVLTMALHSDSTDEHVAVMEKPGAKLKKLRLELQSQMAQRRSELWKKQKNVLENVATPVGDSARGKEGFEEGSAYDILDDEEEEFDVEEEEDEDLLENDIDMSDKKQDKKSAFIEDEAELSEAEDPSDPKAVDHTDDDEDESEDDDELKNDEEEEEEKDDIYNGSEEDPESKESCIGPLQISGKKKMRRIIAMDDSDDENETTKSDVNIVTPNNKPACKEALDSTDPWEDDDSDSQLLCPNAQRPSSRQRTPQLTRTKSSTAFGFITPVHQLTALQSLQSFGSSPNDEEPLPTMPTESPVAQPLMPDPSPLRGNGWHRHLLFPESAGVSTVNMEELANEICSGKFPSSLSEEATDIKNDESNFIKPSFNAEVMSQQSHPSTQDVLDICSGNFTCTTQQISSSNKDTTVNDGISNNSSESNNISANSKIEAAHTEMCSDILSTQDTFKLPTLETLDDDDDKIISQLLDEEEMEKFRKKFESPINEPEKVKIIQPKSPICGRIMFDSTSSDEGGGNDEKHQRKLKVLKKKRKKKCLIDDSDEEEHENERREIDNKEFVNEDEISDEGETQASAGNGENVIDYDSEENEVDQMVSKPALCVNDFLENEAELSESDWDSADEDEKGLDELDIEAGDEEKFDEDKLRTGIERVQLRQMLDEDNKDLKLLQEMLLEDGELHGTGRERQFRWKNIDNAFDVENTEGNENDEEYLDDAAADSEELWRKKRHERVLFLESKKASQEKENDDNILSSNSILKLGQKAIVRNASSTQNSQDSTEETEVQKPKISLTVKQPFSLLNKRGSFLSRGEKVLAKVAEFTKTNEKISAKGPTKFSRNFLFSTVLNDADVDNTKKRKADDGTPIAIKKLRLNNLSPDTNRFTGKNSAKKLFGNT